MGSLGMKMQASRGPSKLVSLITLALKQPWEGKNHNSEINITIIAFGFMHCQKKHFQKGELDLPFYGFSFLPDEIADQKDQTTNEDLPFRCNNRMASFLGHVLQRYPDRVFCINNAIVTLGT